MRLSQPLSRWLLGPDSDPSVRWRTLVEVMGRSTTDPRVRAARSEVGRVGWAAQILAEQLSEGQWATPGTLDNDLYRPKYIATNWRMIVLGDLGVTRSNPRVRRMMDLIVRRWGGPRGNLGGKDSHLCQTGNALRSFLQLGYADSPAIEPMVRWLLRAQKADGGWHCFPSRIGTLDGWEGLAAFARLPPSRRTAVVERAISHGAEFYLDRHLFQEGRGRYAPWFRTHYPNHYYYDLLLGLDILTRLGYGADPRLHTALNWLIRRRDPQGRWMIDATHPDLPIRDPYGIRTPYYSFVLERPGTPSRWATVSALAILERVGRAREGSAHSISVDPPRAGS